MGFVVGGVILQVAANGGSHLRVFALLFLAAAVARSISAALLSRHREPLPPADRAPLPSLGQLMTSLVRETNGSVLCYLLVAQFAIQISGPYFTPFMLGHLG